MTQENGRVTGVETVGVRSVFDADGRFILAAYVGENVCVVVNEREAADLDFERDGDGDRSILVDIVDGNDGTQVALRDAELIGAEEPVDDDGDRQSGHSK